MIKLFGFAFFLAATIFARAEDTQSGFEGRLNQLLIWKLSDELGLKPAEEEKLKTLLKKFQDRRKEALRLQETSLTRMSSAVTKSADDPDCAKCLDDFEKAISEMAAANTGEFKEMKTLLGPRRLEHFLVIRNQMTKDVKDALLRASPANSSTTAVGSPGRPSAGANSGTDLPPPKK